jgi:hypothetical protein
MRVISWVICALNGNLWVRLGYIGTGYNLGAKLIVCADVASQIEPVII